MDSTAAGTFKRCSCGRPWTWAGWQSLPLGGLQHTEDETGHFLTEHRHCPCGSTLAVEYRPSGEEQARAGVR